MTAAEISYVPGTQGYPEATERFVQATLAVSFELLHDAFLPFIPPQASRVLDVGAGIGRDAFVLAKMGHTVTAVEPTDQFRVAGQALFPSSRIHWLNDSLPALTQLNNCPEPFDFVLASGVWHHLMERAQQDAISRIAHLLRPGGFFALTLRNGPAGVGTHVVPTDAGQLIQTAKSCGLAVALLLEKQPSLLPNKHNVWWTKLVLVRE